ncbi:LysR family transcriptional regulator [Pseudomonas aeruginosa]|nr:LysR family transcriptional regulator [Pseudomonas aeruginosa]EIU1682680.1 LysR family transcriptional regulator [Pseudomonas aeruginosa]EKV4571033.1 LysR family transcriptional regulator [Pseudomonas aeruginosa]KSD40626.2 LysR family transcriptional regulator [Pseudomonas aeruginosa]MBH8873608.1 LysR family transcriptional regulator [Pseudomonas aeruginosa]MBI8969242.1 LysR family transcriptional regulator [Pseudomonas aeruginosa]
MAGWETHKKAQWLCQLRKGPHMLPDTLSEQFVLYLDVLDGGSFSAAARKHPLTPSAVARRMDALERAVGSTLLVRTTHAVRATPAGLAFADRARRIVTELRLARAEAVSLSTAPQGLIRIDAPVPFGRRHLAPAIADFLKANPGLDVQLRLIGSFIDLLGEHLGEVDLVLRAGPLPDSRLVATSLAPMVRVVCASPEYLREHGVPASPGELPEHAGIDWDNLSPPYAWRFQHDGKLQQLRPKRARLVTNNAEAMVDAALAGLGIAHLPTWLCSEYLLRGELQALFCDDGLPAAEPTCIYALRLEREASSRTRLLLAFLRERFGFPPPWDQALQQRLGER